MAFLLDRFFQWPHLFDAQCFAPESAELKFRYSRDSRRRAEQNVRSTISTPNAACAGDAELELRAPQEAGGTLVRSEPKAIRDRLLICGSLIRLSGAPFFRVPR